MHLLSLLIFLQIVSESFPVSSSGHVALILSYSAHYIPQQYQAIAQLLHHDVLMFMLHIPTIVIVAIFFRSTWWPLLITMHRRWYLIMKLILYTLVADAITTLFYIGMKLTTFAIPLCVGFIITALLLISLRWVPVGSKRLKLSDAALLGLVQGVALLPGISRLGSVYCASRWLGFSCQKSFAVSWMLQFPLMIAAVGMSAIREIYHPSVTGIPISLLLIGVATIFSYAAFWITNRLSEKNLFWLFGIYMIVPIMVCLLI